MKLYYFVFGFLFSMGLATFSYSQQLAFPGAEGYGKYTSGGRGGIVIEVTNLNDAGTGSLRDALTGSAYKYKKRTVVFRVSGNIDLQSTIQVKYDSCITIAGQTAPGDGICVRNFPISLSDSKNIIVRYMRFRLGDKQTCNTSLGECDMDAFSVRKCHHIVLDHCSFSWSMDDLLDLTVETGYTTVQYCILSEPLNNSKHSKGAHGYAAGWDGYSYGDFGVFAGSTFHHNLIACANSRTPRMDSYAGENNTGRRDIMDVVNNVIYNWSSYGAYGGEHADLNWMNNYYKYGPNTTKKNQIYQTDAECKIYVTGNYVDSYSVVTSDNTKGIYVAGAVATAAQLDTIIKTAPVEVWPISMETADVAYSNVLNNAGATKPKRDTVDNRIIYYVKNRSGSVIDSQDQVGGWPELNSATPPVDSDHDGMPDVWETAAGLNPNDASDRNGDFNGNGYTNLEDYLNGVDITSNVNVLDNNYDNYCKIYPNPASENFNIDLFLNRNSSVMLELVDVSGRKVQQWGKTELTAGIHTLPVKINNPNQSNSLYFFRISVNGRSVLKKLILSK